MSDSTASGSGAAAAAQIISANGRSAAASRVATLPTAQDAPAATTSSSGRTGTQAGKATKTIRSAASSSGGKCATPRSTTTKLPPQIATTARAAATCVGRILPQATSPSSRRENLHTYGYLYENPAWCASV